MVKQLADIGYTATVVSNEKSKKIEQFKNRPDADGCGGEKCEQEKAKDAKEKVDGVTGATEKK